MPGLAPGILFCFNHPAMIASWVGLRVRFFELWRDRHLMPKPAAPPCIVWFRDDLRLSDHPALHAAASTGAPVICLYVFEEIPPWPDARPLGGASRWWLAQSLRALQKRLNA